MYTIRPSWWIRVVSAECSTSDRYFSSLSRSCISTCFKRVMSWTPARKPRQAPSVPTIGVVAISVWMREPSRWIRSISKISCEFRSRFCRYTPRHAAPSSSTSAPTGIPISSSTE